MRVFVWKYAFEKLRVHANAKMSTIIAGAAAAALCCIAFKPHTCTHTYTGPLRVFIGTTAGVHKWNSREFVRFLRAPPVRNFPYNFFCENENFHSLFHSLCVVTRQLKRLCMRHAHINAHTYNGLLLCLLSQLFAHSYFGLTFCSNTPTHTHMHQCEDKKK